MAEHPNAAKVRELMEGFNTGINMESLLDRIDDNIVWHEIGRAEPIRGKAALGARQADATADYTIEGKLHDVVANDDHTIALVEATATRGGRTFTYKVAEIYHIKDGKVTERWAFSDDTAAINAFFEGR
jgi:ketosteroid isomerase-like protein